MGITKTSEEIRCRIAELQGWTDIGPFDNSFQPGTKSYLLIGTTPDGKRHCEEIPDYPGSLDACQPLMEEVCREGAVIKMIRTEDETSFVIYGNDRTSFPGDSFDNPALVLCIAYLRWKGVNIDHLGDANNMVEEKEK